MGLVQRVVEAAGIPTVSLSMIPAFTSATGVPRLGGISHPMSRPMGRVGDAPGQRAVLQALLRVLEGARHPGEYVELPFTWPESPAQARKGSDVQAPIARLLARKPWLLPRLYSGEIPGAQEAERADRSPDMSTPAAIPVPTSDRRNG